MCGRFVQYSDPDLYRQEFQLDLVCAAQPRYNVAPSQNILAIRAGQDAKRRLHWLRWGLIPAWSRGPEPRFATINARAETLAEKPAFRMPFRHQRCLVPSEGFYEWRAEAGGKQPYLIRSRSGRPFVMAGLWDSWRDPAGRVVESCALVVTQANDVIRPIHERMPVILAGTGLATWLDPGIQEPALLTPLLGPCPPEWLECFPVSRRVNSPYQDDAELPLPLTAPRQGELAVDVAQARRPVP